MNALQPVPFWVLVGESCVIKTRKSAAAGHLTASVNSNTKLPGLWLTQSRIKTLEPAGRMVAAQDKGPQRLPLSKVGMCQGKTKEKQKKKWSDRNRTNLLRRSGGRDGGLRPHVFSRGACWQTGWEGKEGKFKLGDTFLPFTVMTQRESCKHTHTELRRGGQWLKASMSQISADVLQVL